MAAHTDNEIVIRAPLPLVWVIANDVAGWPELFAGEYAEAEVLEREGNRVRFRLTTVPGPDGRAHRWVSERYLDPERHTVVARRVEPGPFAYMHIFQSFREIDGGTRLRWVQDFEVHPDAALIEAELAVRIDRHSKLQLERHRQVIEARHRQMAAVGWAVR
jgi:aromatase